jgi:hypothetical protein
MQASPGAGTVDTLNHLVTLERDMIAALDAVRGRVGGADRAQLDLLLTEHTYRLPVLEQQVRELGGQPPDPAHHAAELPRDAHDIRVVGDDRGALSALVDDHEALADAYREALAVSHEDEDARRMLELFASEMEQDGARLAALLPTDR